MIYYSLQKEYSTKVYCKRLHKVYYGSGVDARTLTKLVQFLQNSRISEIDISDICLKFKTPIFRYDTKNAKFFVYNLKLLAKINYFSKIDCRFDYNCKYKMLIISITYF